jgi:hypothetical protein
MLSVTDKSRGAGDDVQYIGTPSPNSELWQRLNQLLLAVSLGCDVRIGVGHFLTLNAGQPIRQKGFRLSEAAWFQRIISGKRFDPDLNRRTHKVGKT